MPSAGAPPAPALLAPRAGPQYCAAVREHGAALWRRLLYHSLNDPTMVSEMFKQGSDIHRMKVTPQACAIVRLFRS